MKDEKYEYLISPNGQKLDNSKIREYMETKKELLKNIRMSGQFNQELESGDLSYYYTVLEDLKLMTPNNNKIEDDEVYNMFLSDTSTEEDKDSIDKFRK